MRWLFRSLAPADGTALTILVVSLPLLMGLLGLVLDAGLYSINLVQISNAADSASRAAASAMDFDFYRTTGELRLDPNRAQIKAQAYAQANYDGAVDVQVLMPPSKPYWVSVRVRTKMQTIFMRVLGIPEIPVQARGIAQLRKNH